MLRVIKKYIKNYLGLPPKMLLVIAMEYFASERTKKWLQYSFNEFLCPFSPDHFDSLSSKNLIERYYYYKHIICYEIKLLILNMSSSTDTIAIPF